MTVSRITFSMGISFAREGEWPDSKVQALQRLGEKKKALEELDQLLQLYSAEDNYNEEAYLELRKLKDELETPAPSTAERLVRSLFGRL